MKYYQLFPCGALWLCCITNCMQQSPTLQPCSIDDTSNEIASYIHNSFLINATTQSAVPPILQAIKELILDNTLEQPSSQHIRYALVKILSGKTYDFSPPTNNFFGPKRKGRHFIFDSMRLCYDGQREFTVSELTCTPAQEYEHVVFSEHRKPSPWHKLSFEQLLQEYIAVHAACKAGLPFPFCI